MDMLIECVLLVFDLSQVCYVVDFIGLVLVEVVVGLLLLLLNYFYFYLLDLLLEGDGVIIVIEDSDFFDQYVYCLCWVFYQGCMCWQNVLIVDIYNYDCVLMFDGVIQSVESDELLYYELLVQLVMFVYDELCDVLIIGGGEGVILCEVLFYVSVWWVVMVDFDWELVELCCEYLFQWYQGVFDDLCCELFVEDGWVYFECDLLFYDVVIIDVVDMFDNGLVQVFYICQFYELLYLCL